MTTTDRGLGRRIVGPVALVAGLLAGLIVLGACSGSTDAAPPAEPGEPADPAVTAPRPDASFSADVRVVADGVRVSYRLVNRGPTPLLVPDLLPVTVGNGVRYPPGSAYVVGQGPREDGRVQVAQRVFAWPDGDVELAQAPRVGVSRVPPGGSKAGELTFPLIRSQPFGDDLGDGVITLPDPVRSVAFCLGVLATPPAPAVGLSTEGGVSTVAHGNASAAAQYLFCGDPVAGP